MCGVSGVGKRHHSQNLNVRYTGALGGEGTQHLNSPLTNTSTPFSLSLPREEEDDNDYIFLVLLYLPSSCSLGLPPSSSRGGEGKLAKCSLCAKVRVRIFSVRGTDKDVAGGRTDGRCRKKKNGK